ncbi:MAG: class I SAM-dependent methyltransferase [Candidatus Sulfopaludibacter sp.]|nr:class I SAM-dependent methyltransferase [Candidatus Sulfopaludibacter sp.]
MSACLICGSATTVMLFEASDRLYRTTQKKFSVVRCAECGLVRLDPVPRPGELPRYYPDNYWFTPDASPASRMEEAYRRLVLRDHVQFVAQAARRTRARGPLLDVGCGGGLFLGMMRERGFRVLGLDNSREAAAIAWRRQQAPAVCAMLEKAPFRAGSVAVLTMFHVLEHLYDPRAYLTAAYQLLEPDGRLVVQVPNAGCWQFRLLGPAWNGVDVPRHLFDFRAGDVEKLVQSCGFEVVRRKFFSLRDNPAGLASSLAPSLDPMARRVRRIEETGGARIVKDLAYLALVAGALPFTMLEAACGAGSTVMIEARRP